MTSATDTVKTNLLGFAPFLLHVGEQMVSWSAASNPVAWIDGEPHYFAVLSPHQACDLRDMAARHRWYHQHHVRRWMRRYGVDYEAAHPR